MILIWKGKSPIELTLIHTYNHWNKGSILKKKNIWNKEELLSPPTRMSQLELDSTSAYTKARMWKWVLSDLVILSPQMWSLTCLPLPWNGRSCLGPVCDGRWNPHDHPNSVGQTPQLHWPVFPAKPYSWNASPGKYSYFVSNSTG